MELINKYKQGKIYMIKSPNHSSIYIGSTIRSLNRRFSQHKCLLKYSSKDIIEAGEAYIELIQLYPCNSKIELLKKEGEIQKQYINQVINLNIAGRTKEEYYDDNQEKLKNYREENKDNKKIYDIEYRSKNKNKYFQKNICACGGAYMAKHKTTHEKTNKHINFLGLSIDG